MTTDTDSSMDRQEAGTARIRPRTRVVDEIEAMVEQCRDCEDMSPYVWHPMDELHDYMEEHGYGMQDFLNMLTGDFTVEDDRFQIDYMGHLVSCTDAEYRALLADDSWIIERIWDGRRPEDDDG